jgi:hypothetical protein
MNKHFFGIILLLFLGTFSWGQGTKEYFDIKKSREEGEILRGILFTKFSYLSQKPVLSSNGYLPDISSFYLPGEGMVFVISLYGIPTFYRSSFPTTSSNSPSELSKELASLNRELVARTRELMRVSEQLSVKTSAQTMQKSGISSSVGSGTGSGAGGGSNKATAIPPEASAPPALSDKFSIESKSNLEKSIEELKEKIKSTNREIDNMRSQNLSNLSEELRPILVETLANYGDSLTTVKPDEYINFVLGTEATSQKTRFIISVSKTWVIDYKAGRLTLDAFKQKVIQYND